MLDNSDVMNDSGSNRDNEDEDLEEVYGGDEGVIQSHLKLFTWPGFGADTTVEELQEVHHCHK